MELNSDIIGDAPQWAWVLIVYGLAIAAALALHAGAWRLFEHWAARGSLFRRALVSRSRRPARLAALLAALGIASRIAPLAPQPAAILAHAGLIGVICLVGWIALVALKVWAVAYTRRFKMDVEDNLVARKHVTQVKIMQRVVAVLILVVTLAAALLTFEGVEKIGISLLASAGAAGIIAGLALQPVLTNLIAGVQIALTQPIRIDDAVLVEGEFGRIEEINSTYVVVKLWDWRRLVLPLTYFIQNPFQNWTREKAELIGQVILHLDFAAPVEAIRSKLTQVLAETPLWDGQVANVAVVEATERAMQVRCLVSARNAGDVFDLRCLVREKLLAWLSEEHPEALPRERMGAVRLPGEDQPAPPVPQLGH